MRIVRNTQRNVPRHRLALIRERVSVRSGALLSIEAKQRRHQVVRELYLVSPSLHLTPLEEPLFDGAGAAAQGGVSEFK